MICSHTCAQDPVFGQFFATPLELNPAFAGRTEEGQLTINYRNQWPEIRQAYVTYGVSYDRHFPYLNSGFGLSVLADNAGRGLFKTISAKGHYSYFAKFNSQLKLRLGISAGILQTKLNWDKYIFPDQLDPEFGSISGGGLEFPTEETAPIKNTNTTIDIATGALIYSPIFYVGIAYEHLNGPSFSFFEDQSIFSNSLNGRLSFHAGAEFDILSNISTRNAIYWAPAIQYTTQSKLSQINLGSFIRYASISVGAWYRHANQNPDAIILAFGLHDKNYRITYSYDVTISRLKKSGGAHEISIIVNFDRNESKYNDCFNMFR